jgi:hypothetical protein
MSNPNSETTPAERRGTYTLIAVTELASLKARIQELDDLASNVAGMDESLLKGANLSLLRATLREFRDQARAALQPKSAK